MNRQRLLFSLNTAFEAVIGNLFRSILTALGIIFGVAAVIAMLAIGKGAEKEISDQLKLVGVNNIEIKKYVEEEEEEMEEDEGEGSGAEKRFSPGLTLQDLNAINTTLSGIDNSCPEVVQKPYAMFAGKRQQVNLIGTTPDFFSAFHFDILKGNGFSESQLALGAPVCIIGKQIESKLFSRTTAVGKYLKCGKHWLKVIGVTNKIGIDEEVSRSSGIRNYNEDIYVPVKTFLFRFKDKGTEAQIVSEGWRSTFISGSEPEDYHQLDRIVVQMADPAMLKPASQVLERMMLRRHNQVADFEIVVPELLLKQEQRQKEVFNAVLFSIAFISLIVGGIGIMNIMLASVYERIKEIGIRRSMGATERDIIRQFLLEAVIISLTGGFLGIFLGISISFIISLLTEIETIVSPGSVLLSFGVAAGVGLIFGIMPARRAARQDPISSLRHE